MEYMLVFITFRAEVTIVCVDAKIKMSFCSALEIFAFELTDLALLFVNYLVVLVLNCKLSISPMLTIS